MHNQRVERRPTLGRIDARHRLPVGRIRREAVDRLGWESDDLAGADQLGCVRDRLVVDGQDHSSVRYPTDESSAMSPLRGWNGQPLPV